MSCLATMLCGSCSAQCRHLDKTSTKIGNLMFHRKNRTAKRIDWVAEFFRAFCLSEGTHF